MLNFFLNETQTQNSKSSFICRRFRRRRRRRRRWQLDTMDDLSINDYIETIFAADGDDAKLRAAMVTIKTNIQVIIDEPFVTARSIGLPPRWEAIKYLKRWSIWSPDGLRFTSQKEAMDYIGFKSGDQTGKLTDEIYNAKTVRLPDGWTAKKGTGKKPNWICINPEGKSFSSLQKAKNSLIAPADASHPTMAAADASTVTSLTQRLVIAETKLSQVETTISQLVTMLSGLGCEFEMTESEDAKPSAAKPAAKSTKAKRATKHEANMVTKPIWSFMDQKPAARVSLDGPSFSSAVAVTAKKGKGKKRTLLDSDDDELSCELSSSPDF